MVTFQFVPRHFVKVVQNFNFLMNLTNIDERTTVKPTSYTASEEANTDTLSRLLNMGDNEEGAVGSGTKDLDLKHVPLDELKEKICYFGCSLKESDSAKLIGCDNPGCPIEWFHIECVGFTLDNLPAEDVKWVCAPCKDDIIRRSLASNKVKDSGSGAKDKVPPRKEANAPPMTDLRLPVKSTYSRIMPHLPPSQRRAEEVRRGEYTGAKSELQRELETAKAKLARQESEMRRLQRPAGDMDLRDLLHSLLMGEEDDEENQAETAGKMKNLRKKSGLYRRAADEVIYPQRWPHLSLKHEYRSRNMSFNDLSLPLFVAGEMDIVMNADEAEKRGRLQFLSHLMYDASHYDIADILRCYAAWLRDIELGHKVWGDEGYIKVVDNILKRAVYSDGGKGAPMSTVSTVSSPYYASTLKPSARTWFCTLYNRNRCDKASPHIMAVKGYGTKEVAHICGTCYLNDKLELPHPECSSACPHSMSNPAASKLDA